MNPTLQSRLEQILPRVTDAGFLSSSGIGNEIACYIFEYSAGEELEVREHIESMKKRFGTHHRDIRVLYLDLFDIVLAYLTKRGLLDKALAMHATKGDVGVRKALRGPLAAEKVRDFIAETYHPGEHDLVLLSGVGSAWPILRAHGLLNCLHTIMKQTPLVMFYPGSFDGTTLRLFGRIAATTSSPGAKPYYRAFILVPRGTQS